MKRVKLAYGGCLRKGKGEMMGCFWISFVDEENGEEKPSKVLEGKDDERGRKRNQHIWVEVDNTVMLVP